VNAAIVAVRLASATLWSVPPDILLTGDTAAETATKFRPVGYRHSAESVVFAVDFKFFAERPQEGAKPLDLIKISCAFEAEYLVNPKFKPTDEQLKAFHEGNVIFNCWPYFREFVQNSTVRMHLPPPPIPFLRISAPKKAGAQKRLSGGKALKEGTADK
jgi:hypothetical protein